MIKFKVGDRVTIKSKEWFDKQKKDNEEILSLKDAIGHCKEVQCSVHNSNCKADHRRLENWLTELLEIKLKNSHNEQI